MCSAPIPWPYLRKQDFNQAYCDASKKVLGVVVDAKRKGDFLYASPIKNFMRRTKQTHDLELEQYTAYPSTPPNRPDTARRTIQTLEDQAAACAIDFGKGWRTIRSKVSFTTCLLDEDGKAQILNPELYSRDDQRKIHPKQTKDVSALDRPDKRYLTLKRKRANEFQVVDKVLLTSFAV
ncbi:hypothetical protein Tco_0842161 [Tanacetum coccineum]|uniref:Uncharacterized protein n=1 Tax=Tanacetum coccineum TaxID=301880 RepID=A0ABQ5B086_9ASTR